MDVFPKIPKKGDMQECQNYKGIMLLSVPEKILNRVILDRLKTEVDGMPSSETTKLAFVKTDHAPTK